MYDVAAHLKNCKSSTFAMVNKRFDVIRNVLTSRSATVNKLVRNEIKLGNVEWTLADRVNRLFDRLFHAHPI